MRTPRKAALCALAAATLLGTATLPASAAGSDRVDFTLTVLFSSDMESALLGVPGGEQEDGTDEGPIVDGGTHPYGSPSRMATLIDKLRAEATRGKPAPGQAGHRGEIVISGGDNFLPGPEYSASTVEDAPFYDALALKHIGFDVSIIGNHDFDFGPDELARFLDTAGDEVAFVSANLDVSGEPALAAHTEDGTLATSRVFRTAGERIGIIGLTTPELPTLSSPRDVEVKPELAEITNALADDFARRGIDKVVLVSHLQDIDNELALVPQLRGVDAVLGAGGGEILANEDDRLIPGDVPERGFPLEAEDADGRTVPVIAVTGDYKYVGRLVLNFDRWGRVLDVDEKQTGPARVSGVGPDAVHGDPIVRAEVEKPVAEHVASLAEEVVATSEVPLNGVRNDVRSRETNLGNLVADSILWAGRQQAEEYDVPTPQVAIQNGGGIRNDSVLPAGEVTALNTYEVAPFANFVAVVPEVPRDVLRQLLERGVAAAPDASGAFMQVAGLTFTYDPARQAQEIEEGTNVIVTPGERVRDVVLADGTVLVADGVVVEGPPVSVATNDFSARGGDGYPFADLPFTSVGLTHQLAVQGFLSEGLGGTVTAADYPEGGEGRITSL